MTNEVRDACITILNELRNNDCFDPEASVENDTAKESLILWAEEEGYLDLAGNWTLEGEELRDLIGI